MGMIRDSNTQVSEQVDNGTESESNMVDARYKLCRGLWNHAGDKDYAEKFMRTQALVKCFNDCDPTAELTTGFRITDINSTRKQLEYIAEIFSIPLPRALFIFIIAPIRVDIGSNVEFKGTFWANNGLVMLDAGKITFGKRVMLGPNVQLIAESHPVDVVERRKNITTPQPITIGEDVWIGGGAIVVGPCTIGNGVTVAGGAVVTGDIPDNVVVAGNPARIVKHLAPPPPFESPVEFLRLFKGD